MMLHQNLDVNCRITSEIKIQNSLFFKQSSGLFCICICVELIQVSINFCSFSKEVCFYLTLKQLILFALNPRILERYGIFLQNIIFVNKNRNQALNFNVSISIVTWLLAFKILRCIKKFLKSFKIVSRSLQDVLIKAWLNNQSLG